MKRVMITGASGQLGLALCRLMKGQARYEILQTGVDENSALNRLDITDEAEVENYIKENRPDIIINCAAFTAVDLCESQEDTAYRVNALGVRYLAQASERIGAKLVHVSTDYVFDGQAERPYEEEDSPNPVSAYGRTKRAGECFALENCSRLYIVRTAWVYGEGKNFVKTMLRLAESGSSIRVVEDQYGTPTSALELARAILFLVETDAYGIYHATCEGSTNWYEFACTIFQAAGLEVMPEPIPTSKYPTPARRPMYSVLDNKALREKHGYYMKDWKDAFYEFMAEEGLLKA
ncbi:dTDP-4-dehydrorhamnose reductase [Anaerotaenia torta]|uniref:dTDP-4-dehydrorhamnose reductase n=1 Tax=Anaerotaenia torta TaxID=433293 RepID=UPI003D214272